MSILVANCTPYIIWRPDGSLVGAFRTLQQATAAVREFKESFPNLDYIIRDVDGDLHGDTRTSSAGARLALHHRGNSGFARMSEQRPESCTEEARREGCTCRMETVHSASIDPPEQIVDQWCPLHGWRDPDREYDEMRDRQWDKDLARREDDFE